MPRVNTRPHPTWTITRSFNYNDLYPALPSCPRLRVRGARRRGARAAARLCPPWHSRTGAVPLGGLHRVYAPPECLFRRFVCLLLRGVRGRCWLRARVLAGRARVCLVWCVCVVVVFGDVPGLPFAAFAAVPDCPRWPGGVVSLPVFPSRLPSGAVRGSLRYSAQGFDCRRLCLLVPAALLRQVVACRRSTRHWPALAGCCSSWSLGRVSRPGSPRGLLLLMPAVAGRGGSSRL